MTVAIPLHRALSTKFAGRSFQLVTRLGYNPWLARVDQKHESVVGSTSTQLSPQSSRIQSLTSRSYATSAAARPAGRPKAHTGRTPARRTTKTTPKTTPKTTTSKKPGPKTPAGKAKVGRKPKAKTPAKPKKAAKKAPSKSALLEKRRAHERELKAKALLDTPKALPATPWQIIFAETHQKGKVASLAESQNVTKEAAQKLKNLTPEEREHYNHEAHLAREKNEQAHKKWLNQHTPEEVREANNARNQLKKLHKAKYPNSKHTTNKYPPLKDDRLVKRPATQYNQFTKDRHASGDFANMTVIESSKLIAREWKALDAGEKKEYEARSQADLNRYIEEYRSVYGKEPPSRKQKSA